MASLAILFVSQVPEKLLARSHPVRPSIETHTTQAELHARQKDERFVLRDLLDSTETPCPFMVMTPLGCHSPRKSFESVRIRLFVARLSEPYPVLHGSESRATFSAGEAD